MNWSELFWGPKKKQTNEEKNRRGIAIIFGTLICAISQFLGLRNDYIIVAILFIGFFVGYRLGKLIIKDKNAQNILKP